MATSITGKPNRTVGKLKIARNSNGSHVMKATWNVPNAMIKSDSKTRATGLDIRWKLDLDDKKKSKDPKEVIHRGNERLEQHSINLNSLTIGKTKYTRNKFYPHGDELKSVSVSVRGDNSKGNGKYETQTFHFKKPRQPKIDAFQFNTETGTVSTTIRTNAGNDEQERHDTYYTVRVLSTKSSNKKERIVTPKIDRATESTAKAVSYDVVNYQQLSYNDYVRVRVVAHARGYRGNSKLVSKSYYVSYPAQAQITSIGVTGKTSVDKCTVNIKTNHSTAHPVDRVRLEYLANCEYADAASIPADASWTETNIIDDKDCTALAIPVANVKPDRGKHTWIRVKSWHANEEVLYRYSNYMEVKKLFQSAPTATDDDIKILSSTAGSDGQSIVVQLGWNVDGQDDSTGTELTWSEEEDTWKSTETPSEHLFTWSDGQIVWGNVTYRDSAKITIKNLQESTRYFIKARRYLENEQGTTYSNYSEDSCNTSETPESVILVADRYVPLGSPYSVRWTFSGYSLQKTWQIIDDRNDQYALTQDQEVVSEKEYYSRSGAGTEQSPYVYTLVANPVSEDIANYYELVVQNGAVIASGDGSNGFASIPAERMANFADVDSNVTFRVLVSTGGEPVKSEPHTVTVVSNPVLTVESQEQLTAQPFAFDATVTALSDLIVIITSKGISGQTPRGSERQADGDTVYSNEYSPDWVEEDGAFTATITAPEGLDFIDSGDYALSVVAIDRTTGLKSEEVIANFTVDWDRKADNPDGHVQLTVIDTVDEDGDHTQAVQIDLTPPDGSYILSADTEAEEGKGYYSRSGSGTEEDPYIFTAVQPQAGDDPSVEGWYELSDDVYDIYRMDVSHPTLIGRNFPLTHTAVDEYAPFGDSLALYYRVALRTPDGDEDFVDVEYQAQCEHMRFDWSGGSLELPYGLTMGDSYKKDFELRQHMDGSSDGYWNENIERKSSLHSDIIKIIQPRDVERARTLARYPGAVFVRLPDGSAYEADVQVTDLSKKNDAVTSIAIDANEIGLTQEFALPIPYTAPAEPGV